MDLHCQILVDSSCCRIKFRIYMGHVNSKSVDVAIRHLSESEAKKGLGCMTKKYWLKMPIVDITSGTRHQVLMNKSSIVKRLSKVGISKSLASACIASADFSLLGLNVARSPLPKNISSSIFYSHGPLL
jgi:hypothetical protein